MTSKHGDELMERLLLGADDGSANQLLGEIGRGYPVNRILRLTHSDVPLVVGKGAWIISELGPRAAEMMDEVDRLLDYPVREVRFFAVDAALRGGTIDHAPTIAKAIMLIGDPDDAVRWKVLQLLARAPQGNLKASVPYLADAGIGLLVRWLAGVGGDWLAGVGGDSDSAQDVVDRLTSDDRLTRLFAAAAAARLAPTTLTPLELATASADDEVSSYAKGELGLPRRRPRRS